MQKKYFIVRLRYQKEKQHKQTAATAYNYYNYNKWKKVEKKKTQQQNGIREEKQTK